VTRPTFLSETNSLQRFYICLTTHKVACVSFRNMKTQYNLVRFLKSMGVACSIGCSTLAALAQTNNIPNRLINYDGFLAQAADVGRLRNERRVTEEQFMAMAAQPGTVVFDARSDDKYAGLHIKGAKHLNFSEITENELAKVFPTKSTRILIYCNNNFLNAPNNFASKAVTASLNIHTFNTLFSYGYTNVYELGPLVDINKAKLPFEGTRLKAP
jgi:phage shock protein E